MNMIGSHMLNLGSVCYFFFSNWCLDFLPASLFYLFLLCLFAILCVIGQALVFGAYLVECVFCYGSMSDDCCFCTVW